MAGDVHVVADQPGPDDPTRLRGPRDERDRLDGVDDGQSPGVPDDLPGRAPQRPTRAGRLRDLPADLDGPDRTAPLGPRPDPGPPPARDRRGGMTAQRRPLLIAAGIVIPVAAAVLDLVRDGSALDASGALVAG